VNRLAEEPALWHERPSYETTLHRLIEECVARNPDRVALVFEDERLTYRELNERANQLARYLVREVKPEDPVGVLAERSIEMVVALLGILKAGGAYVPLDPTYPRERLDLLLADAGIRVVLTQSRHRIDGFGGRQLCLDTEWIHLQSEPKDNPAEATSPRG